MEISQNFVAFSEYMNFTENSWKRGEFGIKTDFNQVVSIFRTEKPEMLGTGLEIITSLLTSRFPRMDNMGWIFLQGRNGMIKWCIVVNTS